MARNWVRAVAVFLVGALTKPVLPSLLTKGGVGMSVGISNHLREWERNDALNTGDYRSAIRSYEACLALDPNNRYCSVNYSSSLVDNVYPTGGESAVGCAVESCRHQAGAAGALWPVREHPELRARHHPAGGECAGIQRVN